MYTVSNLVMSQSRRARGEEKEISPSVEDSRAEEWLPYMEVRDLQALEEYLRNHRDFARMLNLKVSD